VSESGYASSSVLDALGLDVWGLRGNGACLSYLRISMHYRAFSLGPRSYYGNDILVSHPRSMPPVEGV
jgi:hypothetical protein